MSNVSFTSDGFEDYVYWQSMDKRVLKKINALINDVARNGHAGIGSPEPLKGNFAGCWSRRIDDKNRFLYSIKDNGDVEIIQCRGHYGDK